LRAQQCAPEFLVLFAVPDLTHRLLGGVAQGETVVATHGEWSDATGKRLSVGGDVHQAPGTAAERPWAVVLPLLDADLRLGGARRAEEHAQLAGDGFSGGYGQEFDADLASLEKIGAGGTDPGFAEELAELELPDENLAADED